MYHRHFPGIATYRKHLSTLIERGKMESLRRSVMKKALTILALAGLLAAATEGLAHPGSGIVVDNEGNVFFLDTGSGVWKIDTDGKLTKLSAPAYHWMAIDVHRKLADADLPRFSRGGATVARDSEDPRIIVSSDFPIAVGHNGGLYYAWSRGKNELQLLRLDSNTQTTVIKALPSRADGGSLGWLNGIAAAADGSIYYAEDKAIQRITPRGDVVTVFSSASLPSCDQMDRTDEGPPPYFRGLDVDAQGAVYVAATGCRSVVKISVDGEATTVLSATAPWSPTAVAVSGNTLYVLEYLHTPGDDRSEWLPRVRKVSSDGTIATVATIER
jgi:sugar lactone lactonase YvrE